MCKIKRVRLKFESIQQVVGNEELAVILLTDVQRARALSVVCDETLSRQLLLRLHSPEICKTMLPEALVQMLDGPHEMMVFGLHDGQYQVVLADSDFERTVRLRMSDAVLLSILSDIPLYIEDTLFRRQSVAFDEQAKGIAIPINAMDADRLNEALQSAIEKENYELASQLRDEIRRRKTTDDGQL